MATKDKWNGDHSVSVIPGSSAFYLVQNKFLNNGRNIYFLFISCFVLNTLMYSILATYDGRK